MADNLRAYRASVRGGHNRAIGERWENMIEHSLQYYRDAGLADVQKTPEPMVPISRPNRQGHFTAIYEKKAQVDFSGTLRGGRAVRFEAKATETDRFQRSRLTDWQMDDLRRNDNLGAWCFILLFFVPINAFYRVPFLTWDRMEMVYGKVSVTANDLAMFRLQPAGGLIKIFDWRTEE